jgi:hypothetical protein
MTRIEEIVTVASSTTQALRVMRDHARARDWMAPDLTFTPISLSPLLTPGDRFRIELVAGLGFDCTVEAVSDRELVLEFRGPWSGRERWSFIADGAETIVRRTYEVTELGAIPALAFNTVGRALIAAHYKLELARFRAVVERDPGARAEIEGPPSSARSFPVDEG